MQYIRYSQFKLWAAAVFTAAIAALMLALFVNPDFYVPGRFGLLVNGSLGHFLTVPVVVLACSIYAVRTAMLASGAVDAISTDEEGVTVTTLWRSRQIAWREILQIRLSETRVNRRPVYSLKFDRRDGGSISLSLAALAVPRQSYYDLAQMLSDMHLAAINSPLVRRAPAAPQSQIEADPAPLAPTRPSFGRRGL